MSKEANSQYLLEVKHEYSRQLCNLLVPVMYEGIHSIYNEATKNKKDTPMKIFQILLSRIPQWNQHIITNEYQRILNKTQCDFIADLITAVFISHAKILSSVKSKKKSKTLNLKVPNGDYFIHKAYIECARYFWKNPYLFCDNISTIEYQRNMREAESVIEQSINETVRKLLPVKNILQQYIHLEESSSSGSSSSSSESSSDADGTDGIDIDNNKNKKKKKKYANESDTDPDAVITKESIREKQYITNNITNRDKKHLEKMVKTTLASTPKELSIIEPIDGDTTGGFSIYNICNDVKEITFPTLEQAPEIQLEQAQEIQLEQAQEIQLEQAPEIQLEQAPEIHLEPIVNNIKTVVISPTNSVMMGVEEITLNDFNMENNEPVADNYDNYDTIDMGFNAVDIYLTETTNAHNMDLTDPFIDIVLSDVNMPEPLIDIFTQKDSSIEKNYNALLPKPSSIMSDGRSMNSRIDDKLDNISNKKTEVSVAKSVSKSVSATIKTPETTGVVKNIILTQPIDSQTQMRQPNLKKKTDTAPKYSFF